MSDSFRVGIDYQINLGFRKAPPRPDAWADLNVDSLSKTGGHSHASKRSEFLITSISDGRNPLVCKV